MNAPNTAPPPNPPLVGQPPDQAAPRPWRIEGLPKGQSSKRRRWIGIAAWVVGNLVLFSLLTMQDRMAAPETLSYTEFKHQVAASNVAEVFARGDTIEGKLKNPAPSPKQQGRTYQQFKTERPTFAADDLLTELAASGATVRATPIVQERGFITNLLFSFAPMLLLFGFYFWIFRRQQSALGGGILGRGASKRVDPETVRVTFDDVAGIDEVEAEINEVVDFLRDPGSTAGWARARRKACCWPELQERARRCSPAPPREKPRCRSSAPARRSSSR